MPPACGRRWCACKSAAGGWRWFLPSSPLSFHARNLTLCRVPRRQLGSFIARGIQSELLEPQADSRQSARAPELSTTSRHLTNSVATKPASRSGVPPTGSQPSS